jgi:hypothetical protein
MLKSVAPGRDGKLVLVTLAAIAMVASVAIADEPKCDCPATKAAGEVGVPILSNVPYINRLFKNVTIVAPPCANGECPVNANETFERIGVDFDFCVDSKDAQCQACPVGKLTVCDVAGCKAIAVAAKACGSECCACKTCACEEKVAATACPFAKTVAKTDALWEKIVELSAGQAAAEAALAGHKESLESSAEMLEALAEVHAEKARLEAKLEAHEEHDKLTAQMLELATENIRLKAQVELAEAKAEVMGHTVEITVENERLKMQLAELTKQPTQKTARTAAKLRTEKKAR